jgi:hypothetical protein
MKCGTAGRKEVMAVHEEARQGEKARRRWRENILMSILWQHSQSICTFICSGMFYPYRSSLSTALLSVSIAKISSSDSCAFFLEKIEVPFFMIVLMDMIHFLVE